MNLLTTLHPYALAAGPDLAKLELSMPFCLAQRTVRSRDLVRLVMALARMEAQMLKSQKHLRAHEILRTSEMVMRSLKNPTQDESLTRRKQFYRLIYYGKKIDFDVVVGVGEV